MPSSSSGRSPLTPARDFDEYDSDYTSDASDDDGVFLGPRQPRELEVVAKLSSVASTPSPRIFRARKRDSRDFLRRKTLMLTAECKGKGTPRPNCLPPRFKEESSDSDEDEDESTISAISSTPLKAQLQSDLSFQFAAFHLSTPRPPSPEESDDGNGSDKENVPMPPPEASTSGEHCMGDVMLSIGQNVLGVDSEDEIHQLDMGGLKLSDFEDPDVGPSCLHPTSVDEHSDASCDSPLPVARAGPVVIPVLSHHFTNIRAETGSPCRPIPTSPLISMPIPDAEDPVQLNTLRDSPSAAAEPLVAATPSRTTALPPMDLVERGKKLLKSSTLPKPLLKSDKSGQRALAIRGQLDSVLSTRISVLGPPQRSVSSSSSASTASSLKSSASKPTATIIASSRPLAQIKPVVQPSRPEASKPLPRSNARPVVSKPRQETKKPEVNVLASSRPPLRPTVPAQVALRPKAIPVSSSIPLKRPLPHAAAPARVPLFSATQRPTLGQPSRFVHPQAVGAPPPMVPVFSVGVSDGGPLSRPAFRSPAKPGCLRRAMDGTPRRQLGTPIRFGTPRQVSSIPFSLANDTALSAPPVASHDVTTVYESTSAGPPSTVTRQATEQQEQQPSNSSATSPPARGSSEDHEEVSVQLEKAPSSSPPASSPTRQSSKTKNTRPRRKPTADTTPAESKGKTSAAAAGLSEKEIKSATQRNTMRNQVYHCAIERVIVRKNEPRPPSPTSKIRTTADREEEEKKASRGARAKRRTGEESPEKPVIETLTRDKAPGDEGEYVTPARIAKKAKVEQDRYVKWDRGVTVIRDDGSVKPPSRGSEGEKDLKSCLKDQKTSLDQHGNLVESSRTVDNLKRSRVVVTAVFYEGEEPVPSAPQPSSATRSKKK